VVCAKLLVSAVLQLLELSVGGEEGCCLLVVLYVSDFVIGCVTLCTKTRSKTL